MDVFLLLLARLAPLYVLVGLGYLAGRRLHVHSEGIAAILIYVLAPVVVFDGTVGVPLTASTLSIPVVFLILCCALSGLFYFVASLLWSDAHRNILAFTAGTGNTGYFGIPVSLAIFGEQYLGLTVLSLLGFIVYENSVGFFVTARGRYTVAESLRKVLRLPTLYAFLLAVVWQRWGAPLPEVYEAAAMQFRGAYSVLGMMMIGLGIASMQRFSFDWAFTGLAFLAKFIAWPAVVALLIAADRQWVHWFSLEAHRTMLLMSIVPMAANTIAFAVHLRTEPEKAAVAVLLSTLVALVLIPIVASTVMV